MRRGIGVSAFKNRQNDREKYAVLGKEMEVSKLSSVRELLAEFQEALIQFATKHRARINSDPEFRLQFHSMCRNAGVDPLASNRGIWSNALGIGDFYFDLGIIIIEICLKVRAQFGGLISVADLLIRIHSSAKAGSRKTVSAADINRAVEKISVLGNGFRIVQIMGNPMVLSLPLELNKDHEDIIGEAQDSGFVTQQSMMRVAGWPKMRFDIALKPLLQDGIVWLDMCQGKNTCVRTDFRSRWHSSNRNLFSQAFRTTCCRRSVSDDQWFTYVCSDTVSLSKSTESAIRFNNC